MFVCLECKNIFEEPKEYVEKHRLESPPYEHFYCCPFCGGDYSKTFRCDGCGEWITGNFIEVFSSSECFCEECFSIKNIE